MEYYNKYNALACPKYGLSLLVKMYKSSSYIWIPVCPFFNIEYTCVAKRLTLRI